MREPHNFIRTANHLFLTLVSRPRSRSWRKWLYQFPNAAIFSSIILMAGRTTMDGKFIARQGPGCVLDSADLTARQSFFFLSFCFTFNSGLSFFSCYTTISPQYSPAVWWHSSTTFRPMQWHTSKGWSILCLADRMYVVVITSVFTGLALLVVALRLYTRIYMVKAPGLDDLIISCALVCTSIF